MLVPLTALLVYPLPLCVFQPSSLTPLVYSACPYMLNSQGLSLKSQVNTLIHPQASSPSPFSSVELKFELPPEWSFYSSNLSMFLLCLKACQRLPFKGPNPFTWPTHLSALALLSPPCTSYCLPLDPSLLERHP